MARRARSRPVSKEFSTLVDGTIMRLMTHRGHRIPRWGVLRILAGCALAVLLATLLPLFEPGWMPERTLDGAIAAQALLFLLALAFHQIDILKVEA